MAFQSKLVTSLLLISMTAFAAPKDCPSPAPLNGNENAGDLLKVADKLSYKCILESTLAKDEIDKRIQALSSDLCYAVGNNTTIEEKEIPYAYEYQRILYEAACTNLDDEKEAATKVKELWDKYKDKFLCASSVFNVQNGNLLKLAVNHEAKDFILDVLSMNLDLNQVDKSDGRTVLDYVKDELDKKRGGEIDKSLIYYKDLLIKHGAICKKTDCKFGT